jgi:(2R)-sulfolactate sulfo-lyase subunit alpha
MLHSVLVHQLGDDVGVAVADILAGAQVGAVTLDGEDAGSVKPLEDIPLGHKLALRDIPAGTEVIKYGRPIGRATQPIARGAWVHTHNLRTMRWSL